jgi:hypothetical protein
MWTVFWNNIIHKTLHTNTKNFFKGKKAAEFRGYVQQFVTYFVQFLFRCLNYMSAHCNLLGFITINKKWMFLSKKKKAEYQHLPLTPLYQNLQMFLQK